MDCPKPRGNQGKFPLTGCPRNIQISQTVPEHPTLGSSYGQINVQSQPKTAEKEQSWDIWNTKDAFWQTNHHTTTFAPHLYPPPHPPPKLKFAHTGCRGRTEDAARSPSIPPDCFIGWSHLCTNYRRSIRLKVFFLQIPKFQSACLSDNLLE